MNVYKMSLTFLDENTNLPISVPKSVFSSVASRFIGGESPDAVPADREHGPGHRRDSFVSHLHPGHPNQAIHPDASDEGPRSVLRCLQGCDVTTLLKDMETSLKRATRSPRVDHSSLCRTQRTLRFAGVFSHVHRHGVGFCGKVSLLGTLTIWSSFTTMWRLGSC